MFLLAVVTSRGANQYSYMFLTFFDGQPCLASATDTMLLTSPDSLKNQCRTNENVVFKLPVNFPVDLPVDLPVNLPVNLPVHLPVNQSVNVPVNVVTSTLRLEILC